MTIYKVDSYVNSLFDTAPTLWNIDPDQGEVVYIGNQTPIIGSTTRTTSTGATNDGGLVWNGEAWVMSPDEGTYAFMRDDFDDPNGSLQSGTTLLSWVNVVGLFNILSNGVECKTDGDGTGFARYYVGTGGVTDLGNTDMEVGFRIDNPEVVIGQSQRIGALLRYDTATDSGYAVLATIYTVNGTTGRLNWHFEFYKIDSGVVTALTAFSNVQCGLEPQAGDNIDISFRVVGFRISVFMNEQEVAHVNRGVQEYFHNTHVGICGDTNGYSTGIHIDDFWAKPITNSWLSIRPTWEFVSSSPVFNKNDVLLSDEGDFLMYLRWKSERQDWYGRGGVRVPSEGVLTEYRYLFPRKTFDATKVFEDYFTDTNGTALSSHTPDIGYDWQPRSVGTGGSANIQSSKLRITYGSSTTRHWLALTRDNAGYFSWHSSQKVGINTTRLKTYTEGQDVRQGILVRYLNADDLIVAYVQHTTNDNGRLEIAKVTRSSSDANETITVLASTEVVLDTAGGDYSDLEVWDVNGSIIAVYTPDIVGGDSDHYSCAVDYYTETVGYWKQQGLREYKPNTTWQQGIWCYAKNTDPVLEWTYYNWYREGAIKKQVADTPTTTDYVPVIGFTVNDYTDTNVILQGGYWEQEDDYFALEGFIFERFIIPDYYFYNIQTKLPAIQTYVIWSETSGTIASVLAPFQQEMFWLNIAQLQSTLAAFTESAEVYRPRVTQISQDLPPFLNDAILINPVSIAEINQLMASITGQVQASYNYVYEIIHNLPAFVMHAEAASEHAAAISQYLATLFSAVTATPENTLDVQTILGAMVSSATSPANSSGSINQQLAAVVSEALVEQQILTTIVNRLSAVRQSIFTTNLHIAGIDSALPAARLGMQSMLVVASHIDQALAAFKNIVVGSVDCDAQISQAFAWITSAAQAAADYEAQINQSLQSLTADLIGTLPIGSEITQTLQAIDGLAEVTGREIKIRQELVALNTSALVDVILDTNTQSLLAAMTADAQALGRVSVAINTGLAYLRSLATVQAVDDATINSVLSAMVNAGQISVQERGIYKLLLKVFASKSIELKVHGTDEINLKVTKDEMRHL